MEETGNTQNSIDSQHPQSSHCGLNLLKIGKHNKLKKSSLQRIVEFEQMRNYSCLCKEISSITKQKYNHSNSSHMLNKDLRGLSESHNINLEDYLTDEQSKIYRKCIDYLEDNNLPKIYSYYIIDFFASTQNKFVKLSPDKILTNIASKYIFNVNSVLSGFASPCLKNTTYETLPKPFSPLFFELMQFVSAMYKGKNLRKNYEDCLQYTFIENFRNATYRVLHSSNEHQLKYVINESIKNLLGDIWIPEQVSLKYDEMKKYLGKIGLKENSLLSFVNLSYIYYISGYGMNSNALKGLSSSDIFDDMRIHLGYFLDRAPENPRSYGWCIFDSSTPNINDYLYISLNNLYNRLLVFEERKENKIRIIGPRTIFNKLVKSLDIIDVPKGSSISIA